MSLDKVQSALIQEVSKLLGSIPAAYENLKFTPPNRSKWAAVHFVPNTPEPETLGDHGRDYVTGFVQVDLHYQAGSGSSEARADFESIRSALPAGRRLEYDGQQVTILSCGRTQGTFTDVWFKISVTINWYALIPR